MTERQRQVTELVGAFNRNKTTPCKENLEALFEVIEQVELEDVLIPVLELAFEAIQQYALNIGEPSEAVIQGMRRVPALS